MTGRPGAPGRHAAAARPADAQHGPGGAAESAWPRPASILPLGGPDRCRALGEIRVYIVGEADGVVIADEQHVLVELFLETAFLVLGPGVRRQVGRPFLRADVDILGLLRIVDSTRVSEALS